jgi:hypothetical protein
MARGRTTSLTIHPTPAQRRTLLAWQRATAIPAGLARRGRIILLVADRIPIAHVAATVGMSRRFVYKWVQRFLTQGGRGIGRQIGAWLPWQVPPNLDSSCAPATVRCFCIVQQQKGVADAMIEAENSRVYRKTDTG